MQKIVYILGAGFSRPLGLPIMSDFIDMAKDLYSIDPEKYSHFSNVFKIIHEKLAWVKTVYDANLNNIEEILSILEMLRNLDVSKEKEYYEYKKFLIDVINYYTPKFSVRSDLERIAEGTYSTHNSLIFGILGTRDDSTKKYQAFNYYFPNNLKKIYISFVLGLFNASLESTPRNNTVAINCVPIEHPYAEYSVITLNYDLVLEKIASLLSDFSIGNRFQFSRATVSPEFPTIAHLHGSVDSQNIISPTWNKTIDKNIEKDWQTAYQLLESANHIRIMGYSLPITDSYIRYLLKASILNNNQLKSINVICLDDERMTIKKRYDEFIQLPADKYKFMDQNVTDYLASAADRVLRGQLMDDAHKIFSDD